MALPESSERGGGEVHKLAIRVLLARLHSVSHFLHRPEMRLARGPETLLDRRLAALYHHVHPGIGVEAIDRRRVRRAGSKHHRAQRAVELRERGEVSVRTHAG